MKNRLFLIVTICCFIFLFSSCGEAEKRDQDTMFQVATLQSLMQGEYSSLLTVDELLQKGDFGIGTFKNVDGEMILLDGVVYQAKGDSTIKIAEGQMGSPFAIATYFDGDISENIAQISSLEQLKTKLDATISQHRNTIWAVRIDGSFRNIKYRSEYPVVDNARIPLAEWLQDNQISWEKEQAKGTIVAIYFPEYFSGLNASSWHMHFISNDKTFGGHLFDVNIIDAIVQYDKTEKFNLYIPDDHYYQELDLAKNKDEDIEKVEKNTQ